MTGLIILGIIIAFIVVTAVIYNSLVTQKNRFKNAFAQIDVQLKRRYDLIPNLVEVVKKYMQHERETLEAVIAARNSAVSASNRASENPGRSFPQTWWPICLTSPLPNCWKPRKARKNGRPRKSLSNRIIWLSTLLKLRYSCL